MFTETDRNLAIRSCRFCPMCHHADLVTTLERRETYSARARGLTLFALEAGMAQLSEHVADIMYRFFVDGLCRHVCAGHIPHDDMIIDARQRLVIAGHAPQAVTQVKKNIANVGNPWGEIEPDLCAFTSATSRQQVLVFFGSTARIKRVGVIRALNLLMNKVGIGFSVLSEEGDPGLLLHQLGEHASAAAAAEDLSAKIAHCGARTVITPDAEAYQAFKIGFGATPPLVGPAILHTSEFFEKLICGVRFTNPEARQIAYHDPCALARSVPCLNAPRAILSAINGAKPLEIGAWNRELANCSGECGGVPFTVPSLSKEAARRRVQQAREVGANLIVTGSPAAAAVLEGFGIEVLELSEFVARQM